MTKTITATGTWTAIAAPRGPVSILNTSGSDLDVRDNESGASEFITIADGKSVVLPVRMTAIEVRGSGDIMVVA